MPSPTGPACGRARWARWPRCRPGRTCWWAPSTRSCTAWWSLVPPTSCRGHGRPAESPRPPPGPAGPDRLVDPTYQRARRRLLPTRSCPGPTGRRRTAAAPEHCGLPWRIVMTSDAPPTYGGPAHGADGYGAPGHGAPGYGAPGYGAPGYGAPG